MTTIKDEDYEEETTDSQFSQQDSQQSTVKPPEGILGSSLGKCLSVYRIGFFYNTINN